MAAEAALWRARVVSSQLGCRQFCRCATHHAGLASKLHAAAICLLRAALQNCSIVGPPVHLDEYNTAMPSTCLGFDCYFQPISTCGDTSMAAQPLSGDQRHLLQPLAQVARLTGLRSELLVMATCVAWIMRPRPALQAAYAYYASRAGLVPRDLSYINEGHPGEPQRCVAAHVRHGDKKSYHAQRNSKGVGSHLSAVSFWRWGVRLSTLLGAESVLFMTDDPASAEELTSYETPIPFVPVPAPLACFAVSNRSTKAATDVLHDLMRQRRTSTTNTSLGRAPGCGPHADEGLLVLSGVLLLAECIGFVGTQSSNLGRLVAELMAARRFPPAVWDVTNDVWASGASGVGLHEVTTWAGAFASVPNTRNDRRPEEMLRRRPADQRIIAAADSKIYTRAHRTLPRRLAEQDDRHRDWRRDYARAHQRSLLCCLGPSRPRHQSCLSPELSCEFVVATFPEGKVNGRWSGGFADRAVGMMTMFALAVSSVPMRPFFIDWPGSNATGESSIGLSAALTTPRIDAMLSGGQMLQAITSYDAKALHFSSSPWDAFEGCFAEAWKSSATRGATNRNGIAVFVRPSSGGLRRLFNSVGDVADTPARRHARRLVHLGLRFPDAFGELWHFLFEPSPMLTAMFKPLWSSLAAAGTASIGLQIRTGDANLKSATLDATRPGSTAHSSEPAARSASSFQRFHAFFGCARSIESQVAKTTNAPRGRWFVMSDSPPLTKEAARAYPDRVLTPLPDEELAVYSRYTGKALAYVIGDVYALSFCRYRVISARSGLGRIASFISNPINSTIHVPGVYGVSRTHVLAAVDRCARRSEAGYREYLHTLLSDVHGKYAFGIGPGAPDQVVDISGVVAFDTPTTLASIHSGI